MVIREDNLQDLSETKAPSFQEDTAIFYIGVWIVASFAVQLRRLDGFLVEKYVTPLLSFENFNYYVQLFWKEINYLISLKCFVNVFE